jgi:hypothetical protein
MPLVRNTITPAIFSVADMDDGQSRRPASQGDDPLIPQPAPRFFQVRGSQALHLELSVSSYHELKVFVLVPHDVSSDCFHPNFLRSLPKKKRGVSKKESF